jgi:hypothetical protein
MADSKQSDLLHESRAPISVESDDFKVFDDACSLSQGIIARQRPINHLCDGDVHHFTVKSAAGVGPSGLPVQYILNHTHDRQSKADAFASMSSAIAITD